MDIGSALESVQPKRATNRQKRTNSVLRPISPCPVHMVGSLSACLFAQRGHHVELFEYRQDIRRTVLSRGHTINLSLSARGRRALSRLGLEERVLREALPLCGRMLHLPSGELRAAPYDPHQNQCIYSIERKYLNELLLTETEAHENVKMHFGHKLIEANLESGLLKFQRVDTKEIVEQHADLVVGADGAFSSVRRHMMLRPHFDYSQQYCDHGYLELAIPPADNGQFAMPAEYLHLWPRGHCMMLAMPNRDHSWTVTLFLPFSLFNKLNSAQKLIKFFQINFPDSIPLIGRERLVDGFFKTKPSPLISIKCRPYHVSDRAVLLGDAAHAMVPFYGQGMNAGFEDCAILDQLLATRPVQEALQQFSDTRWKDAHAICDLALYNFSEISSRVAHRSWMARRSLDIALYGLLGCYWLPLYQAVCFTDCSYSECRAHQKRQNMVVNGVIGLFMMMTVIVIISSMKMIWPLTS